ncbi:hypothetical protein [Myxococcus stipitatus]|uniref:hypothetical protein n=1 Tax=Myxococcus stipitatus TaxID=83455 RepID=UPI0030CBDDFC
MPIDPGLDENGNIRVLVPIFGAEASVPYPQLAPVFDPAMGIEVLSSYYESTLQAAASIGMGGLFQMKAEGFYKAVVMDFRAGFPKFRTGAPGTTKILGTFWGVTVRVAMRVRTIAASARMDLASLAASVETGAAEVQYSVSAVGVDRRIFAAALRGVPLFGKLDYTGFARLSAALVALKAPLTDRLSTHPLLPISVWVENPFDANIISEGRSVRWAMSKISSRVKYETALAQAPSWANLMIARRAYQDILGNAFTIDVPEHAAKRARDWLKVG